MDNEQMRQTGTAMQSAGCALIAAVLAIPFLIVLIAVVMAMLG